MNFIHRLLVKIKNLFSKTKETKKKEEDFLPSIASNTVIYLVRHGETDWNLEKKLQGQIDILLNKTGQTQSEEIAKKFSELPITKCFTSDLLRAYETMLILKGAREIPVSMDIRLRERNFGEFEGVSYENYHKVPEKKRKIETDEQVRLRTLMVLKEVADQFPHDSILVVTHAGNIKTLLTWLLQVDIPVKKIQMNNVALLTIQSVQGRWQIKEMQGIKLL